MKTLIKKFLVICSIIAIVSVITNFATTQQAQAFHGDCRYFLGMSSWDCNVDISDENSLKTGILVIAANVATDITVAAAYLIIGYVIYGGYLYVFSSGDPNKVTTGKKALTQAFIGLAIVMSANIILNAIRVALGVNFAQNCVEHNCADPSTMVTHTINWVIGIAGIVSAIFVVYGGISYITSSGDSNKLQKAKNTILYALIGLVIVALATIITSFVSNMIREANKTSLIETTKEYYEIKKTS